MLSRLTFLLVIAAITIAEEIDYDQLFDPKVDIDEIMDNDRVLNVYLACLYDEGPCGGRPQLVKGALHDILATTCAKCNDQHRERLKYSLNKFIEKRPADWDRILSIFDPSGEFKDNIEKLRKGLPP